MTTHTHHMRQSKHTISFQSCNSTLLLVAPLFVVVSPVVVPTTSL